MGIWQGLGVSQCLSDLSLWNQLRITPKKNTDKGERRSKLIRLHFPSLPRLNRNVRMSKKGIVFFRIHRFVFKVSCSFVRLGLLPLLQNKRAVDLHTVNTVYLVIPVGNSCTVVSNINRAVLLEIAPCEHVTFIYTTEKYCPLQKKLTNTNITKYSKIDAQYGGEDKSEGM